MIKKLFFMKIKLSAIPFVILFISCVYSDFNSYNYFLADDLFRVTDLEIGSNVSFNSLLAETRIYDFLPRFPSLRYKGGLVKPFKTIDPLYEIHDIVYKFPLKSVDLGIRTGVEIHALKYRLKDEVFTITPISDTFQIDYQKVTSSQVNHTELEYCVSGNIGFKLEKFYYSINCMGIIYQQRGYSLKSRNYNYREITHYIEEYEPENISYSLLCGLLAVIPSQHFSRSHILYLESNGEYNKVHAPISANIKSFKNIHTQFWTTVIYSGNQSQKYTAAFNAGLRSKSNFITRKKQLLFPGKFLYGFTFSDFCISGKYQKVKKSEYEYQYEVGSDNTDTAQTFKTENYYKSLSLSIFPECYVTKNISFVFACIGFAMERSLFATISGSLNYRYSFSNNFYLQTSLHSGELLFVEESYPSEYPVFYRKYKAGICIKLIRTI